MNLYLIKRDKEEHEAGAYYDQHAGFVIAAETANRAREIASRHAGCEGKETWLHTFDGNYYTPMASIALLASSVSMPECVVLADYRAG